MLDDWDDFRFVLALCREGSLSGAARALGVDETTVARRLSRAEKALGARLFVRERGRVTPTEAAEVALRRLALIDDGFHGLRDAVSGADRRTSGSVSVTAVPIIANHALLPHLHELLSRHRALNVELVVDPALLGIARRRDADIAIRGARPSSDPDAITRKLGDMHYGVYRRADADPEIGWIAWSHRGGSIGRPQARWVDERLAEDGASARLRVNDGETLLQAVRGGYGKALLAEPLARRFPELVRLDEARPVPPRELWMLMHPSAREVRRIDVVATWLTERVRAFLAPRRASLTERG